MISSNILTPLKFKYAAHALPLMLSIAVSASMGTGKTVGLMSYVPREASSQEVPPTPKSNASDNESGIIRQTNDVTCGPAALASLLKYYFGEETSEDEIARLSGTYEKRTSTLLGLRNAARAKGFQADGYRMTLSQLITQVETSGVPVLVHFKKPTLHYALVLGRVGDVLMIADPSRGNVSMDVGHFIRRWDNYSLVVRSGRQVDSSRIQRRKQSTAKRLDTLKRATNLMSSPHR